MVRTVTAFLVAACLLLFAVEAAEAITGNEWKQLSQTQQQAYVMGVLDAWDNLGQAALQEEDRNIARYPCALNRSGLVST
jgi:hypothetical protein